MKRRSARKIITRVIVSLLLGAIVNVAVAWTCAVFISPSTDSLALQSYPLEEWRSGGLYWEVWTIGGAGYQCVDSRRMSMRVFLLVSDDAVEPKPPKPLPRLPHWWPGPRRPPEDWKNWRECRIALASGWPFLSQSVEFALDDGKAKPFVTSVRLGGIDVANARPNSSLQPLFEQPVAVPLRPIWPGFALNTLFYAGILLALFAAPFALRRRRRIRRGLCPACAYPIGDSPNCTECGKAVTPRSVEFTTP